MDKATLSYSELLRKAEQIENNLLKAKKSKSFMKKLDYNKIKNDMDSIRTRIKELEENNEN